ncbi:MAG: hypothetical protein CM15mP120_25440 [Pseudomonadota bacterium]|nr:MAG: hypothetical protein CM15mP120_25440 [Pseudomonadota bacterium]
MASQPSNNVVIEGQWWDPDSTVAEISLEEEYADEMGLSLGDKLDFDIGGQQVSAVVSSLRSLEGKVSVRTSTLFFASGARRLSCNIYDQFLS